MIGEFMKRLGAFWTLGPAALLILALLTVTACGDGDGKEPEAAKVGDLEITDAFARAGVDPSAFYFTVTNTGDEDDALTAVSAEVTGKATLHETVSDGGSMTMQGVDRIEVPANGEAVLEPGGYHVMLVELEQPLEEGETITVVLTFEKAGPIEIEVSVRSYVESGGGVDGGMGDDEASIGPTPWATEAAPTAPVTTVPAEQTTTQAVTVDVYHAEWDLIPSVDTVPAGAVTCNATNDGVIPHNFRLAKTELQPDALPVDPGALVVKEDQLEIVARTKNISAGGGVRARRRTDGREEELGRPKR
jgi:periplasmic copper chaperone A